MGECSLTVATRGPDSWAAHAHVSISVHTCSVRGAALRCVLLVRSSKQASGPHLRRSGVGVKWGEGGGAKGVKAVGYRPALKYRKVLIL